MKKRTKRATNPNFARYLELRKKAAGMQVGKLTLPQLEELFATDTQQAEDSERNKI